MLTKHVGLAKKLPSPLYKLLAQSYIDRDFPRHLFIETTANCNLTCSYCPREQNKENMDFELFKQIIDEASIYGVRSFSLHLFGEPLLYPHILDAVRYIKKRNKRHTILLTTNGTLLNKFARTLVELGVDRIIWSWRKNNFTPDTIRILKTHGLIRLLRQETPQEEFEKWSKFPNVEVKDLHNYGGNIDVSDRVKGSDSGDARYPCYHLWLAPAVRWNGDITICCNDPHGVEVLGNYTRGDSVSSLWRGVHMESLRKAHLKGEYGGLCKGCNVWKTYPDLFFESQKHG